MTPTRTIQRSPDIGIGIRLKRVPEVAKPPPAPAAVVDPSPPWWWGWFDGDKARSVALSATLAGWVAPTRPAQTGYWPGVWVAVVDNAIAVRWEVAFTPKIWFNGLVVHQEKAIDWSLPPELPQKPPALFTPAMVIIPEYLTLNNISYYYNNYWAAAQISVTGRRDDIPLPTLVAAGNTLTVVQDTRSMSGTLVATAWVNEKAVGAVSLDLIYEAMAIGGS